MGIYKGYKQTPSHIKKNAEARRRGSYFKCLICGKKFWRRPPFIKKGDNKFCSKRCYFKWQKGRHHSEQFRYKCSLRIGEKGTNWKGGITPINRKIRNCREMNEWRTAVLKRDNYTCQKCGAKNKKNNYIRIEAHHKKPFAIFPELRFVIDNGITLCKKCHDKEPKGREILCLKY